VLPTNLPETEKVGEEKDQNHPHAVKSKARRSMDGKGVKLTPKPCKYKHRKSTTNKGSVNEKLKGEVDCGVSKEGK